MKVADPQGRCRLASVVLALALPLFAVMAWPPVVASARQNVRSIPREPANYCYNTLRYAGWLAYDFYHTDVEGYINYVKDDMVLDDNDSDHAAMYVNATSQIDGGSPQGVDWAQGG
jgi:hypothetical protein